MVNRKSCLWDEEIIEKILYYRSCNISYRNIAVKIGFSAKSIYNVVKALEDKNGIYERSQEGNKDQKS